MLKTIKGFTLIEILIVVILLGVIAGFGIPSYNNAREKSDEREGEFSLSVIAAAMENYEYRNAGYPAASLPQIDDINTTLNLGILEQNMDYDCTSSSATFTCTAISTYGWELDISNTSNGVVRCSVVTCPTCLPGGC